MSTTKLRSRLAAGRTVSPEYAGQAALNIAIAALWVWLYQPVFAYLSIIFSREDFRTNQLALVGILILLAVQVHRGRLRWPLQARPHLYFPAIGLALGGSTLFLLVERFLDINTLSAALFGLASYGLVGCWVSPSRWRQGFPAALLLIGVLPFGEHLQTFVGYPMRLLTASLVRDGLAAGGISSIGVDTILVFENGISQVDLPCSGIKSLWTGILFLLAATWLEGRPLNFRWLLVGLMFGLLLFVANLARVAVLIAIGEVAGWRLAAEMLHIPLGMLGFGAVCAAAVVLLRLFVPHSAPALPRSTWLKQPAWLSPALAAAIGGMALLYTPSRPTGLTQPPLTWNFPAELKATPMPLKPDEFDWLTRDGAESAGRYRFEWRGMSGSMILITSRTWRAHHRPERCFEVYGLSLEESRTYLVTPGFPLRFVSLGDGQAHSLLSATYWFQSAHQTTDEYAARLWADLTPKPERWVLVSILFDDVWDSGQADVQTFYKMLHTVVAQELNGGTS